MRILVVKRDKIGDMLLTTPLLAHLRHSLPGAEIHVLANDYNAWVVAEHPDVHRVWVYRRTRHGGRVRPGAALGQARQILTLRRQRFDVAIAGGGESSVRATRRALAVGAARTIAYVEPGAHHRRLSDPLPVPTAGHEVERMLALAMPLGVAPPAIVPDPTFRVPVAWTDAARRWLAGTNLAPRGYVVVGLAARDAPRQPTVAQVLRWSAYCAREHGLATVLQFTPGDAGNALYPGSERRAAEILAAAPDRVRAAPDGLPAAIGLIELARSSVFPDSGLMHFAAVAPGGVVGLFAGAPTLSSPARWGPRGPRAVMVEVVHSVGELADAAILAALAARIEAGGAMPG